MSVEKEFYGVKEVANIIGVSTDRVYEWLRNDYIKGTRPMPHSAWRIHKSELARLRGELPKQTDVQQAQHLHEINKLLEAWKIELDWTITNRLQLSRYNIENEKLFPYIMQHCPSLVDKHNALNHIKERQTECNGNLLTVSNDIAMTYNKWIEGVVCGVQLPGGWDDVIFEYGWSPFRDEFNEATQYLLFGKFAPYKLDNAEEPLNKLLNRLNLDTESMGAIWQAWHYAQEELLKKYAARDSTRNKVLRYFTEFSEAEDALKDAIDTSLLSHEYLKNRCEWCP